MLRNYFITSLRNLSRYKLYAIINIIGLAIGITCFTLILLFITDELSYDKFNSKSERIYRVCGKLDLEGAGEHSSSCPFPVATALQTDYPHLIEKAVRFFNFQDPQHTLKYKEKLINETGIYVADSSVFDVFDYTLAKGDLKEALRAPKSIVLSKEMAQKYFGDENPMGKIMRYDGAVDMMVTGVFNDLPQNSHIHFDALISFSSMPQLMGPNYYKNWVWNPCWTYVLLKPGVKPEELEKQFPAFVQKYYPDFLKPQVTHHLQPLTDIHLYSKLDYEIEANGDISNIYIFSAIGIFILLIACINFMNLATARSSGRAKEVGIRKVAGAQKRQLVFQFLMESVLMSIVAAIIALAFIELCLPWFNQIAGKKIDTEILTNGELLFKILCISLITGLLAGIYPAFFLSSFEPVKVLKGNIRSTRGGKYLRKSLVVLQFSISLVLVICTVVIYRQLQYLQTVDLGFDKEQVVMIPVRPPMAKTFVPFIDEIKNEKGILKVATSNDIIGKHHNTHEFNYEGMEPGKWKYYPALMVNEDFVDAMKMKIVAGRNFSKEFVRDDSLGVIVNEAMVKALKWESPEKAIGQQMFTPSGRERVIGVVKDFNFVSLSEPVGPFVLDLPHKQLRLFWTRYIIVRLDKGDVQEKIAKLESKWKSLTSEYPFEYFFLNDDLNKQYSAQYKLASLVGYFSILAIFIACLGLFALVSFTAEQRTKEIGIRKVLGATISQLSILLSTEFLQLVLLANIIAWPLSWYILNNWLENFAYRTNIEWWVFLVAALLLLLVALFTVIFKALRIALSNPVKALRYE